MPKLTDADRTSLYVVFMRSDELIRQRYAQDILGYDQALRMLEAQETLLAKITGGEPCKVTHFERKV